MRSPWRIAAAVLVLVLVAGIGVGFGWHSREPRVGGKTLGEWLEQYYASSTPGDLFRGGTGTTMNPAESSAARQAILKIGTNGIPALLARVRSVDSPTHVRILEIVHRVPWIPLKLSSAATRRNRADWGFALLGEDGRTAVPELTALLSDPDPDVRGTAARCLGHIGAPAESAIPEMLRLLSERNQGTPILSAMDGLAEIRLRPDLVVPVMIEFIHGNRTSWNYSLPALQVLRAYGSNAAPAVPAIQAFLLAHPDGGRQYLALNALERIDPAAAKHVQALSP